MDQYELISQEPSSEVKGRRSGCLPVLALLIVVTIVGWWLIRPGVFIIQPIGALPEGVTLVYHSRNAEMSFFASPDGLCLKIQGSVNLICRMASLAVVGQLTDRALIKLPYSRWAYLQSTGGLEFDK